MPILLPLLLVLRFLRGLWLGLKDAEFRSAFFLVLTILLTGTAFYRYVEGWRWLDALYFSVITLTTIGYGDFSPQTDLGKIFTIGYIITGLGTLSGFVALVAARRRVNGELLRPPLSPSGGPPDGGGPDDEQQK
jgi:hypothetical protein